MTVKSLWIECFVICAIAMPTFAQTQADSYRAAKIIGVGILPDHPTGGPDAPFTPNVETYNFSIQVGDTVYVCRYEAHTGQDMSWLDDDDVQVRVDGKTMHLKTVTGEDMKATILQEEKAAW